MKRLRGPIILLMLLVSCAPTKSKITGQKNVRLSFEGCRLEGDYKEIQVSIPYGYELVQVDADDGYCEYHMIYPNQSILYVSTNVITGSALNFENRLNAGIETYSENRSVNDSLIIRGEDEKGKYWLEAIRGTYVIGYVNAFDTLLFQNISVQTR